MHLDIRYGFRPPIEYIEFPAEIPNYTIRDIVPREYLSGNHYHDTGVAATILHGCLKVMTKWQLEEVAKWVEKHDRRMLWEIGMTCKRIAREMGNET